MQVWKNADGTIRTGRIPLALPRFVLLVGVLAIAGARSSAATPEPTVTQAAPAVREDGYVGRAVCANCHQREDALYAGSHHDRAMQPANAQTVAANFDNTDFTYTDGVTSRFFKKDGAFFVRTDGPDGQMHEYRIAYTFGTFPLQQYLIEFPDGRLQALSICWDTRPKSAGGQRWFHLYPNEKVDFRDALHWTGPAQNWNYMCAECHSTHVEKNYHAEQNRFQTRWSAVNVSCEACHGPGARHVEWGRRAKEGRTDADPQKGLVVDLAPRGGTFAFEGTAAIAHLTRPRDTHAQVVCARCHARRTLISDAYRQDQPLAQTHIMALLDDGLYYADGQILDEVFEYGSFLQSRMHERGVICTDCHDAHSGRLRADGNAVCATCHRPGHYDTPAHYRHKPGTDAARCVRCHMPARTYMVVHQRHDHSFRVPRPDLSVTLGTPNTCADAECHNDRSAQWAADAVIRWYGPTRWRGPRYAAALAAGRQYRAGGDRLLADVIGDRSFPAIVRATALSLLEHFPTARWRDPIERSLQDPDPLVRRAAVSLLSAWEPPRRWQVGGPLLSDPIRTVRLEAVNALADAVSAVSLTPDQRSVFERAVADYREAQAYNADRAEAWLNLGALEVRLGNDQAAEAAYQRAIRLQPSFIPSYVNLADLYREQKRDDAGERVLRQAPAGADVHFALGLLLVRQNRLAEALDELAKAAAERADSPRYAYVYAVALDSVGQSGKAMAVLQQAQARFTGDTDILAALAEFSSKAGDREAADRWARKLRDLAPAEAAGGGGPRVDTRREP